MPRLGRRAGDVPRNLPPVRGLRPGPNSQGFFQFVVPCPTCHGEGYTISKPCPKCRGKGQVQETRELSVRIPAGVDTGTRLRLRNEGEAGTNGGPNGDLYVFISVDEDKTFRRQGQDLVLTRRSLS